MARVKNAMRQPPRTTGRGLAKVAAPNKLPIEKFKGRAYTRTERKKRHAVAGQASVDWKNHIEMRVFIYVLRTQFNFRADFDASVFFEAFKTLLEHWGFTEGMPVQSLRDQFNQRKKEGRPTAVWYRIESDNQTAEDLAKRASYVRLIKRIANSIATESSGPLMFDSAADVQDYERNWMHLQVQADGTVREEAEDEAEDDDDEDEYEDEQILDESTAGDARFRGFRAANDINGYDDHYFTIDAVGMTVMQQGSGPFLGLNILGGLNEEYLLDEANRIHAAGILAYDQNARISNQQLMADLDASASRRSNFQIGYTLIPDESALLEPSSIAPGRNVLPPRASSNATLRPTITPSSLTALAATTQGNSSFYQPTARPRGTFSTLPSRGQPFPYTLPLQGLDPNDRAEGSAENPLYSSDFVKRHADRIWYQKGRSWAPGFPPNQPGKDLNKQHIRLPKDIILAPGDHKLNDSDPSHIRITAAELDTLLPDRNNTRRGTLRANRRIPHRVGLGAWRIDPMGDNDEDHTTLHHRRFNNRGTRAIAPRAEKFDADDEEEEEEDVIIPRPTFSTNPVVNQAQQVMDRPVHDANAFAGHLYDIPRAADYMTQPTYGNLALSQPQQIAPTPMGMGISSTVHPPVSPSYQQSGGPTDLHRFAMDNAYMSRVHQAPAASTTVDNSMQGISNQPTGVPNYPDPYAMNNHQAYQPLQPAATASSAYNPAQITAGVDQYTSTSTYPNLHLMNNGFDSHAYHPTAAVPNVYSPLLPPPPSQQGLQSVNQYTTAPQAPNSSMHPLQTRSFSVDRDFVDYHIDVDFVPDGENRYRVDENERMWASYGEYMRCQRGE